MEEPIPCRPPVWLTPRLLFLLVVTLGAGAMGYPSAAAFLPVPEEAMVHVTGCTVVLSWLLAWRATRPGASTFWWLLAGGPVAGILNTGLALMLLQLQKDGNLATLLMGTALGSIVGGPLGIGYGICFAVAARPLLHPLDPGAHDAPDRAGVWMGWWLAVVGVAAAMIPMTDTGSASSPFVSLGAVVCVLGLLIAVVGWLRQASRRRWLRRVQGGLEPRWGVAEWAPAHQGLIPLELLPANIHDVGVLMRKPPASQGPYRGGQPPTPVGLFALDPYVSPPE